MGRSQRRKSIEAERELVRLLHDLGFPEARRVPLSGALEGMAGDVEVMPGVVLESKRRASLPMWLRKADGVAAVVVREDRGEWMVVTTEPLETWVGRLGGGR